MSRRKQLVNTAHVQNLEPRTVLSGGPVGPGTTAFNFPGGWQLATQGLDRQGTFDLPVVAADGSVSLIGSSEADTISVERVVGTQESPRTEYGAPVDGEFDFVLLLNDSGEYTRFDLGTADAYGVKSQQGLHRARLGSNPAIVEQWQNDPSEQGQINFGTSSAALARELRDDSLYTNLAGKLANTTFMHYTLDGVYDFYVEVSPEATSRTKLTIDGGAGSDNIGVSQNVPMRVNLFGGSGADKLTSGKKIANLFGGGGNDLLVSRSVQGGTLDGGKGSDRYSNRFGNVNIMSRSDGDVLLNGDSAVQLTYTGSVSVKPGVGSELLLTVTNTESRSRTFSVVRGSQMTIAELMAGL